MSISFTGCNMVATALQTLPQDKDRRYLAVTATTSVTVTISGGEPFTIAALGVWAPVPAPINDIVFTGTGTLIIG